MNINYKRLVEVCVEKELAIANIYIRKKNM